jgi:hypothetical protein
MHAISCKQFSLDTLRFLLILGMKSLVERRLGNLLSSEEVLRCSRNSDSELPEFVLISHLLHASPL